MMADYNIYSAEYLLPLIIFLVIVGVWYLSIIHVYFFYRPDCGYCKEMEPEWKKFEDSVSYSVYPRIMLHKININDSDNQAMADKYKVEGVPFIVKTQYSKSDSVFSGPRTAENLTAFLKN